MEVARVEEFWDAVILLISIPKIFLPCNFSNELPPGLPFRVISTLQF